MISQPRISVVIPAYNAAAFLANTIQSVQQQTMPDWELLIVNDGSSDDTTAIAATYATADARIRLISQANQGVSATRNRGVAESRADLIAFLDADDHWAAEKLHAHLAQLAQHPELGVSFDRVAFVDGQGHPTGQVATAPLTGLTPQRFLYENPTTTTSSWVVRRAAFEQVGGFVAGMSYAEDLEWLFRCSLHWAIAGIDQTLTYYRTTDGSLSSDLYQMEAGWLRLIAAARQQSPDLVQQHFAAAQATHLRYLARRAVRIQAPGRVGWDFLTRSLRSDWRLLLREPRRTVLTMGLVVLYSLGCLVGRTE